LGLELPDDVRQRAIGIGDTFMLPQMLEPGIASLALGNVLAAAIAA